MSAVLTLGSIVSRKESIVSSNLSDTETVMLNIEKNSYYGIDESAREIWDLLGEPRSAADVCNRLLTIFAVDQEVCQRQVLSFLEKLLNEGLIDVHNPA